ncbi:MAG: STY4851/ECs_5259 family protein [Leptospirillia bacterium]
MMGSPFLSWLEGFLKKRDLAQPDRRPLYRYRLSREEFQSLSELLGTKITEYRKRQVKLGVGGDRSLTFIFENFDGFDALFVLYAAEWWRLFYDGTGFSWEPILNSLGTQNNEWDSSSRGRDIQSGFDFWGIPLERGHLRYLSTVARQGGLPMKLLASSEGQIGHLFSRVLIDLAGEDESLWTGESLKARVKRHAHYLPDVYKNEGIFQLLADVIEGVLTLRDQARLTGSEDDLLRLNERVPNWKDQFPFPPSDDHFSALLASLVVKASKKRAGRDRRGLFFERCLEITPGSFAMFGRVHLPPEISFTHLQELFHLPAQIPPPRLLSLILLSGDEEQSLSLRRLSEAKRQEEIHYALPPYPSLFSTAPTEKIRLRLSFPDAQSFEISPPGGEPLDPLLPWIFTEKNDEWVFLRQGGGRVPALSFYLSVPLDAHIEGASPEAPSTDFERRQVFLATSPVRVCIGEERFLVTPDEGGTDELEYQLKGKMIDLGSRSQVYRGFPRIVAMTSGGTVRPVSGEKVGWKIPGEGWSTSLPKGYAGPCEIRVRDEGETVFSSRPVCLPDEAKISVLPESERSGRIVLHSFGLYRVTFEPSASLLMKTTGSEEEVSIHVTDQGGGIGPGEVVGDIWWKGGLRKTPFRFPLPFRGVRAIGPQGESLLPGTIRDLRDLMGVRLIFFPGPSARRISLILQLNARGGRRNEEWALPLSLSSSPQQIEVRLIEIRNEIMECLAHSDDLSATVSVEGEIDDRRTPLFHVARYAVRARAMRGQGVVVLSPGAPDLFSGEEGSVGGQTKGGSFSCDLRSSLAKQVLALRLEAPEEDPVRLDPDPQSPYFHFYPDTRPPGTWVVYPGKEARITFRPVAFNLQRFEENKEERTSLDEAFAYFHEEVRKYLFTDVFDRLVQSFADSDWDRIVELANKMGHLPLSSLDLWRAAMTHPSMMASMLLRYPSLPWEGFLERFSQESLFLWESVEVSQWVAASDQSRQYLESIYPSEVAGVLFDKHYKQRVKALSFLHPSLKVFEYFRPDLMARSKTLEIRPDMVSMDLYQTLFQEVDCAYQRLLRRGAQGRWPQELSSWIRDVGHTPLGRKFWREREGFRSEVVNFPAMLVVSGQLRASREKFCWKHFAEARKLIKFDRDWFSDAYHMTMVSIYRGLLDE